MGRGKHPARRPGVAVDAHCLRSGGARAATTVAAADATFARVLAERRGSARRHDRAARLSRVTDGVLQHPEGAVGAAERGVRPRTPDSHRVVRGRT
jgi:hypothetical protein